MVVVREQQLSNCELTNRASGVQPQGCAEVPRTTAGLGWADVGFRECDSQ